MKKSILNFGKPLSKTEQKSISGGFSCPTYPASQCLACGGGPLPNGCCIGTVFTHQCLRGEIAIP
ncbi:hypothetical protein [uncultured Tenacibaculum sp.]|uniref:hypothetical protein n=1 Tax=uncultured Tenacibaculum sp. TaxID=174713 RepID=UPI0026093D97|nr:hypothetical protein [uncultured Tenacibaculum sp.]